MFLKFKTNEERRKHGGTAFVEFQFCKLKENTKIRKIVSVNSIQNWKDDSLYLFVDDIDNFLEEYNDIFDSGIYNNLQSGNIDICAESFRQILLQVLLKMHGSGSDVISTFQ